MIKILNDEEIRGMRLACKVGLLGFNASIIYRTVPLNAQE